MILQRIANQLNLQFCCRYGWKLRHPRRKMTEYEKERIAHSKLVKEYRLKHIKEYWEKQTELENTFIDNYKEQQKKKLDNEAVKFRTSIIKIANATQKRMADIASKQAERKDKLKAFLLNEDVKKMNRQRVLQMLDIESRNWYNEQNIDKLDENALIPDLIYNETDYYFRLSEEALLFERGDYDSLEQLSSDNKYIKLKNKMLIPIYKEVISFVKHLKNTPYNRLESEYVIAKKILNDEIKNENDEKIRTQKLKQLDAAFDSLRLSVEKEQEKERLEHLYTHLLKLFNLLHFWNQYTKILKMSNEVAESIIKAEKETFEVQNQQDASEDSTLNAADAMQSASEKATSEDEKIDLQKMKSQIDKIQKEKKEKLAAKKKEESKETATGQEEQESDVVESILKQNEAKEKQLEQEFEAMQQKQQNLLYGLDDAQASKDSRKTYGGINLENIFPRSLVNEVTRFDLPKYKFDNVSSIENLQSANERMLQIIQPDGKQKLRASVVVQAYRDLLKTVKQETLSKKDQKLLQDNIKLLSIIEEMEIDEPRLLLKIWKIY